MKKNWKEWHVLLSWAPKSLWTVAADMKLKGTCSFEEKLCKPRQLIKKKRHHFAYKSLYSQKYGFSSSHVYIFESWIIKNAEH